MEIEDNTGGFDETLVQGSEDEKKKVFTKSNATTNGTTTTDVFPELREPLMDDSSV